MADFSKQMELLRDALDEAREQGDLPSEVVALSGIGRIYLKEKIFDAALDYWGQAKTICREHKMDLELAQVLTDLGDLARSQENQKEASLFFLEAFDNYQKHNVAPGKVRVLERLGSLAAEHSDLDQALSYFQEALAICRQNEDKVGSLYFLEQCLPLLKARKAVDQVESAYRELITLSEKLADRERMALGLVGLADVFQQRGQAGEVEPILKMAHDLYLRIGRIKEAELIKSELSKFGLISSIK